MEQESEKGDSNHWTVVQTDQLKLEQSDGPLMVAMQPGVDMPATVDMQEVVIVNTDSGEIAIESGGVQTTTTVVDAATGQIVSIGAVEEVKGEFVEVAEEEVITSENQRLEAEASGNGSNTESELEESSDDDRQPPRKKPKKREFSHRLQWRNKDMLEAMKSVTDKKMTIRGAAKKYGVPYSTLKDRVHGRVQHGTKPGVKTALSPEEEEDLVKYIKDMENAGFQLRCIDVRDRAGEILRLNHGHNSPYKDCSPGHNWLAGFLKRHPGLEFKKSINRSNVPSVTKQKAMCKKFFEVSNQVFKKHKLWNKSDRIYTVAEMRLEVFQEASVLFAAAANGTIIPPFVVFKGQRLKLTSARQAYPEAFFTCSFDGNINEDVLLWWFRDHFLKRIPQHSNRPCVLFLSRSISDVTFQLAQLAKEEKVHLISIPAGISHFIQPLDDELAVDAMEMVNKRARKWEDENPGTTFTQKVLAQILQKVWKKGITSEEVTRKFAQNGLFPLNNTAITNDRITTAAAALKESRREYQQSSPGVSPRSDQQFSGLSLLSALSSHEYATMERSFGGHETKIEPPQSNIEIEYESDRDPEMDEGKIILKMSRRRSPRKSRHEHTEEPVSEAIQQLQSLEGTVTVKDDKPTRHERLRSELVRSKDNTEQINRAIESILDQKHGQRDSGIVHIISPDGTSETVLEATTQDENIVTLPKEDIETEEVQEEVISEEMVVSQEVITMDDMHLSGNIVMQQQGETEIMESSHQEQVVEVVPQSESHVAQQPHVIRISAPKQSPNIQRRQVKIVRVENGQIRIIDEPETEQQRQLLQQVIMQQEQEEQVQQQQEETMVVTNGDTYIEEEVVQDDGTEIVQEECVVDFMHQQDYNEVVLEEQVIQQ